MPADLDGRLSQILGELARYEKEYKHPDGHGLLINQYVTPDKGLASARRLGFKKAVSFGTRDLALLPFVEQKLKAGSMVIVVGWVAGDGQRFEVYVEPD